MLQRLWVEKIWYVSTLILARREREKIVRKKRRKKTSTFKMFTLRDKNDGDGRGTRVWNDRKNYKLE